jgi:hypothetical protein
MATKNTEPNETEAVVAADADVAEVVTETEAAVAADQTVPGGRYLVNGELVDANGKPIKGEKGED